MWDLTNDEYFAKVRMTAGSRWQYGKGAVLYGGGTQDNWDFRLAGIMHAIDVMRYVGADKVNRDAGWHNHLGDNDGPDLGEANRCLRKYGMRLTVWWPLYWVAKQSRVYREHPEWRTNTRSLTNSNLDTSKKEVIDHLTAQLDEKIAKWGDFEWRLDAMHVVPVDGNETPILAQYQNMEKLKLHFRQRHPRAGLDICSGGGNVMGFETLRMADVSQLTDGGSLYLANYYSSYLFPPDKINDWTRDANATWENLRSILTLAPAWARDRGSYGHEPGLSLNDGKENLRRTLEIYRYLLQQGAAGRWSRVYHPRVEGDDPVYYFQRLSRDGKRGVVILRRFPKHRIRIYPKGLNAVETYDVRFEMSKKALSRGGADLMQNGITLVNMLPGELIYLGLPNSPGSGNDHMPPSDPTNVRKKLGTNLGITGVELEWEASADNNWLSHYQIYRDGELLDKVAKGTYYFDRSGGPENLSATYEVEAVDGDGNGSRRVAAVQAQGGPVTYGAGRVLVWGRLQLPGGQRLVLRGMDPSCSDGDGLERGAGADGFVRGRHRNAAGGGRGFLDAAGRRCRCDAGVHRAAFGSDHHPRSGPQGHLSQGGRRSAGEDAQRGGAVVAERRLATDRGRRCKRRQHGGQDAGAEGREAVLRGERKL